MISQRGDSYWRIYIERFHDPAGYRRAVARDATPDRIHPGNEYRVRKAPPVEPRPERERSGTPDEEQPKQPVQTRTPTPTPTPSVSSPASAWRS